jgi:hypothetical protein
MIKMLVNSRLAPTAATLTNVTDRLVLLRLRKVVKQSVHVRVNEALLDSWPPARLALDVSLKDKLLREWLLREWRHLGTETE